MATTRLLPFAKGAVWIHIFVSLLFFALGTPIFYTVLTTPCRAECASALQLHPQEVAILSEIGWTLSGYAIYQIAQEVLYLLSFSILGILIYINLAKPAAENPWYGLIATLGLISIGTILLPETSTAVRSLGPVWQDLYDLLKAAAFVAFLSFCILFPNGRWAPRWTRWVVVAICIWMICWLVLPFPELDPDRDVGVFFSLIALVSMLVAQVYRYRRLSAPIERQQTKWFVFGFGSVVGAVLLWTILFVLLDPPPGEMRLLINLQGQGFLALFPTLFAVCIGVSLLRYRLWDIDLIVNRTLVYGVLTASVVVVYAFLVSGLGLLFQNEDNFAASLLATGVIAVLFQPARTWIQGATNRWLFGEREDPASVLTRLTSQIEATHSDDSLLSTLVKTIASSLKLPYVGLWLQEENTIDLVAETGQQPDSVEMLPLLHQQMPIGRLVVARRSPGEAFSDADLVLLSAIARLTATTARTIQLSDEVQEARVRTVSAREEERRRLRRDLHDGLGPVLASQSLKLAAARQLLRSDPGAAERLLDEVMAQSESTVGDVRRLVYALRPPTLDELGLTEAIREHVQNVATTQDLRITIDAPEDLPEIPAAIEVAALRIVQEALNNVIRHAQASHCAVSIRINGSLQIRIEDDGVGMAPDAVRGVGLLSMRERAAEVGGVCEIESGRNGGLLVRLSLPL